MHAAVVVHLVFVAGALVMICQREAPSIWAASMVTVTLRTFVLVTPTIVASRIAAP